MIECIREDVHIASLRHKTLAIDGYAFLHRGAHTCATELARGEPTEGYVRWFMRKLAKLPANYNLWQEIPGQHDKKITDTDVINLADVGVERFVSLIDQTTEGDALPSKDQTYLSDHGYEFEVVMEGGATGIILTALALPEGKFDHETADVLILLPRGYPDCSPDMFYVSPKLTLAGTGQVPKACKKEHHFAGRVWQRWSRHNNAWRPGVDGLQTMVARVRTALMEARA